MKPHTVIVLSAGASVDYGLPKGDALRDTIQSKMSYREAEFGGIKGGDLSIYHAMLDVLGGSKELLRAAKLIEYGVTHRFSIDDYLDRNSDDPNLVLLGKAAIAQTIIEAENKSPLRIQPDNFYRAKVKAAFEAAAKEAKVWVAYRGP